MRSDIDQVARVIDRYYEHRDGELFIGGTGVSELVGEFGTPLFLYDKGVLLKKIQEARSIMPYGFDLFYSIKANPNASILRLFLEQGCGLEIASRGELHQALAAGCEPERLIFAGPGKTRAELAAALDASIGEIHVESIEEAQCIDDLAKASGQRPDIALRVNPTDAAGGAMQMGGRASPFGIDEEHLDYVLDQVLTLDNLRVVGVHLFMGTQILDATTLIAQYERALVIARRVASRLPHPLTSIDFGGGLGTPYFPHETELDLERLSAGLATIAKQMNGDPLLTNARGILEPGRFLVNEAGIYVASVTRTKESRGETFVVVDGGMHHHLAASGNLGQIIKRNYPVAVINKIGHAPTQSVELVGPLCTPLDRLARGVDLPPVAANDLIGIFQSGAYARTSSPLGFLSHDSPAEVLVSDRHASLIRRRGRPEDHLSDQGSAPSVRCAISKE